MKIRSVTARAFGPFAGDRLELADGLTVITGPNESGKSTWHAAITAAISGMRRGRGPRTKDDRRFTERHTPWNRSEFEVSAVVELPDGRRIELHHDLAGLVDCTATDMVLGTDVTSEILHDGNPDASRFVGLTRTTFRSVASVGQGQILTVLEDAGALQEDLGRAASTAGTDETAAAALQIIDEVLREEVGTDRVNATKPLRRAMNAVRDAEEAEADARSRHMAWHDERRQIAELEGRSAHAGAALHAAQAVEARQRANRIRLRVERLDALATRLDAQTVPERDRALVDEVRDVLADQNRRPEPIDLDGDDAATLRQRIDDLPEPPEGDIQPAEAVTAAAADLERARAGLDAHRGLRPEVTEPAFSRDVDPIMVDSIRNRLAAPAAGDQPPQPVEVEPIRVSGAATMVGAMGVAVLVVGLVVLVMGARMFGGAASALGVVLIVGALIGRSRRAGEMPHGTALIDSPPIGRSDRWRIEEERARAFDQASRLGLPTDPDELGQLLSIQRLAEASADQHRRWSDRHHELDIAVDRASHVLAAALRDRGVSIDSPDLDRVDDALRRYRAACADRLTTHRSAATRPELEQRLQQRLALERHAETVRRRREEIDRALCDIAQRIAPSDPMSPIDPAGPTEEVAAALGVWQEQAEADLAIAAEARQTRIELDALLDGRSVDEHRHELGQLEQIADSFTAAVPSEDGVRASDVPVSVLAAEAERLRTDLARLEAAHRARRDGVPSIAEPVEATAAARDELARVRRFAEDLMVTRRFLHEAQERANRDLAPRLAAAVRPHLARVTNGRYRDIRVNPIDLAVTVSDPDDRWRSATDLSHGTTEQVYLLLRIALAELLTAPGHKVPVLLDDVLVHADEHRSRSLLEMLRDLASDRQIILFSQERLVTDWARTELDSDGRHRHIELSSPA